jgi:hypothetical protein
MNFRLTGCKITSSIDKIRGGTAIPLVVECTFEVQGETVVVSGIATCSSEDKLNDAYKEAIENAKATVRDAISKSSGNLDNLIRQLVSPSVSAETKKLAKDISKDEFKKLYEPADFNKQKEVNNLCEALGIQPIIVEGEWTMIEALTLISQLNRMTEPLLEKEW